MTTPTILETGIRVSKSLCSNVFPYIAMWAMLLVVRQHNQYARQKINTIACPGLGTGIGRVPYTEAARQMALAYDHFLYPPKHLNCIVAAERQLQIWEGGYFR